MTEVVWIFRSFHSLKIMTRVLSYCLFFAILTFFVILSVSEVSIQNTGNGLLKFKKNLKRQKINFS